MGAPAIPYSSTEAERRRLENTLDQDLSTLSLTATSSSLSPRRRDPAEDSFSSLSTIGVGRSAPAQLDSFDASFPRFPSTLDTPKARAARGVSMRTETTLGGISPTSTAGHHVSAATLGAGVFRRPAARGVSTGAADEFDPDRSLGRLVGELAKAMGDERNKPASPFASPRSPSPSMRQQPNLSFTLTRNDPLLSPPLSRSVSSASSGSQDRRQAASRPALGETNRHNAFAPQATLIRPDVLKKHKRHHRGVQNDSADVTGMTGLLATPGRGTSFVGVDKNGAPEDEMAAAIPTALASLHARLRALETENSVSRRRVRELESEIEKARDEVARAQQTKDGRLKDAIGEKTALEDLVKSLRGHLARLTKELEENKALVDELRRAASAPPSPVKYDTSVKDELGALRREVERLSREVARLGDIIAQGLAVRQREAEPVRTVRLADPPLVDLSDDEVDAVRRDVEVRSSVATRLASPHAPPPPTLPSQLRQGLHAVAADKAGLLPPSARAARVATDSSEGEGATSPTPASRTRNSSSASRPRSRAAAAATFASPASSTSSTRRRRRAEPPAAGPDSPFPSIRVEDEASFFAFRPSPAKAAEPRTNPAPAAAAGTLPPSVRSLFDSPLLPPQTVLARVIRELEDEFSHYKSIYVELADQYKVLDVASAVAKRHVLAQHLKEVIDTLELKADQISALYSLLSVSDRPVSPSTDAAVRGHKTKSVNDLWRAVRDSLSEDARRRLEADGLFRK
ncbi:uncharacterized protein LOC62_02G002565 [Vanrija pseudolonga]|uniref:Cep57 centrosome microtubule-binding domain-containing protein n=1 Tax=Vanrija pseudolonga TaxID=143232 RepID=A0AAF0Y8S8_9TREE|nr:hypothetical protein LOC62_02G002565 [Vanrija pseudolonga]